jgi:ketosteroid isomerase-like protein
MDDEQQADSAPKDILERLERAFADRDLEALVGCFRDDVIIEYPAHPGQRSQGRDEIWRLWAPVFAREVGFWATVVRSARVGNIVWAEVHWRGTQLDGSPGDMAGVLIHGLEGDKVAWVHMYMEPVERNGTQGRT